MQPVDHHDAMRENKTRSTDGVAPHVLKGVDCDLVGTTNLAAACGCAPDLSLL